MSFKAYDLLSSLVPGFLLLLAIQDGMDISFDKDLVIAYTAIAFFLGYLVNTFSSWMEDFYFFTWGGKPSSRLLDGKGVWKVNFYAWSAAKSLLIQDTRPAASNDELFSAAMRIANGQKDSRVDDFNAIYAFSRSLLTTVVLGAPILLIDHYQDWIYYAAMILVLFVSWLRCKQRAYYYAREVLNVYLKGKTP